MSLIETQVAEEFLRQLSTDENFSDRVIDGLRSFLTAAQLPKAEELAALFSASDDLDPT